jgi:hypothetical protein
MNYLKLYSNICSHNSGESDNSSRTGQSKMVQAAASAAITTNLKVMVVAITMATEMVAKAHIHLPPSYFSWLHSCIDIGKQDSKNGSKFALQCDSSIMPSSMFGFPVALVGEGVGRSITIM